MVTQILTPFQKVTAEQYKTQGGATLRREYGVTPNGNALNGRWVLRDEAGRMLDHDKYINDLSERWNIKLLG